MIRKALLVLALGLVGCDGGGMTGTNDSGVAPDAACTAVPADNSAGTCLWQLPAGVPCDGLVVKVNDKLVQQDAWTSICGAAAISVHDAQVCADALAGSLAVFSCK